MKKIIVLITLLLVSGCSLNNEEPLISALKKLEDAKNYTVEINASIKNEDGESKINTQIQTDKEKQISYMKMKMEVKNLNLLFETYSEVDGENSVKFLKSPFYKKYIKLISEKEEIEDLLPNFQNYEDNIDYKKISKKDGVITYEATFTNLEMLNLTNSEKNTYDSVSLIFKVKNKEIISFATTLTGENETTEIEFKILNLNKTKIEIPEEVRLNAVLEKDMDEKDAVKDYLNK